MSTSNMHNSARSTLQTGRGPATYFRLGAREEAGLVKLE